MTILAIHKQEPNWPATPERPITEMTIGDTVVWVETNGPAPTTEDVDMMLRFGSLSLADIQAGYRAKVDADAEVCRQLFITPGPGQAMTYQEKFAQAQEVHDMGEEAANAMPLEQAAQDFPVLAAGIGIDAETLWGCSQIVIQMAEQWSTVAGAIERARLQGKKSISDASDAAAAQAAYEAITWPSL